MVYRAVALGFRVHSGWASVIAAAGSPGEPVVLERRRIEIADRALAGSRQPYHAVVASGSGTPEALLHQFRESSTSLATLAVGALVEEVKCAGATIVEAAAILYASGRSLPELTTILRSHPLLHTAEGEFFRDVLAHASEHCGLPVIKLKEREVWDKAASVFELSLADLQQCMNGLGKRMGPPWTQDEKLASLAAWLGIRMLAERVPRFSG